MILFRSHENEVTKFVYYVILGICLYIPNIIKIFLAV